MTPLKRQRNATGTGDFTKNNKRGLVFPRLTAKRLLFLAIGFVIKMQIFIFVWHTRQTTLMSHNPTDAMIRLSNQLRRQERPKNSPLLPQWITDYVIWHAQMRRDFPGTSLFTDPNAPPLLIRTCLGLCGGLHDRLGQLPWDLYLANQTQRVLLLHWHRPVPIEYFLQPGGTNTTTSPNVGTNDDALVLDWRIPQDLTSFYDHNDTALRVDRAGMREARAIPDLFQDFPSDKPDANFWKNGMEQALQRAKSGTFQQHKILRHRLLGHLGEDYLEERLLALGETDTIHWTKTFGSIFHLFFRPSDAVQAALDSVYQDLHLRPGAYSAVHCRVRHPKAHPAHSVVKGKNEDFPADKTGLPWEGSTRQFAVETATRALQCAQKVAIDKEEPIYFFSDSNDLVRYMSHELTNQSFVTANASVFEKSPFDAKALEVVSNTHIVARDATTENAHIDKQKWREPHEYFGTFVDLFLGIHARCVTFGVGYYAIFAAKISGTDCKVLYQKESWGSTTDKSLNAQECQIE